MIMSQRSDEGFFSPTEYSAAVSEDFRDKVGKNVVNPRLSF